MKHYWSLSPTLAVICSLDWNLELHYFDECTHDCPNTISVLSKLSAYSLVSDGPGQAAGGPDDEGAAARHARVRRHVARDTWRWTRFILIYSEKTVYKSVIEINLININPFYFID